MIHFAACEVIALLLYTIFYLYILIRKHFLLFIIVNSVTNSR